MNERMGEWMSGLMKEWMNEWRKEWTSEWINEWTASSISQDFVENLRDEANFFISFQNQNSLVIRIFVVAAVTESPLNKSRMYLPLLWRRHDTPKRPNMWCHIPQHGNHKYERQSVSRQLEYQRAYASLNFLYNWLEKNHDTASLNMPQPRPSPTIPPAHISYRHGFHSLLAPNNAATSLTVLSRRVVWAPGRDWDGGTVPGVFLPLLAHV